MPQVCCRFCCISIHALREEGDRPLLQNYCRHIKISIHALREEGDRRTRKGAAMTGTFLSTPSARRATQNHGQEKEKQRFLSTPSARRATRHKPKAVRPSKISIHALREEGDNLFILVLLAYCCISIHALREEGDGESILTLHSQRISIHALREEGDACWRMHRRTYCDFYPRPPRGGRRNGVLVGRGRRAISIHALREEGDAPPSLLLSASRIFLSTPSARRATRCASHRTRRD